MEVAIEEARLGIAKKHGGPFGCVIVRNEKIVCKAHNTVLKKHDPICHAEINAIKLASKKLRRFDLSDCELYVTGKPCPMCRSAINWAKIKTVYYGCNYYDAQNIGFNEKEGNNQGYSEIEIDRVECLKLYKESKFDLY